MLMTTPFTGAASGFVHTTPTAQTLQDEVEFAAGLEGIPQVHDEGVTHRLQDLSLRPCVCCVLCTAHYFCLKVECVFIHATRELLSSFCYPLRKRSLNEERSSLRPLLQFITFTFTWVIRHCFKCTAYICLYTISTTSLLTDQHHEEAGFQTLLHSQHNGTPQCPHTPSASVPHTP